MKKNLTLISILTILLACNTTTSKKQQQAVDTIPLQHTTAVDTIKERTIVAEKTQKELTPPIKEVEKMQPVPPKATEKKEISPKKETPKVEKEAKSLEATLVEMGLVDVQSADPSIKVDLKYSTTDNFMDKDAYGDLNRCFLQKEVVEMLAKAQKALKKEHPNYGLIVFDGARPFTVQKRMWDIVKGTDAAHYVAKPDAKGSMHNYGCAVDLGIMDDKGALLDMGTKFDHLGREARTDIEADLIKEKVISQKQLENRLILRKAMEAQGFQVLKREWWHFNAFPDAVVLSKYKKIP